MLRQKIVRPLIRLASTQTKNQRGLMEFFRDTSDYGRPEYEHHRHGQAYEFEYLECFTPQQLHELW